MLLVQWCYKHVLNCLVQSQGEVLVHRSHAEPGLPQPIHAEANPCPDRYLLVRPLPPLSFHSLSF